MRAPAPHFMHIRSKGRYTREQRNLAMEYMCPDEEKVYQYKLMSTIALPAFPRHSGEMKFWVEKLLNAICKLDQSGKHVLQKLIKVALYPGPDADVLLRWLEDESQGLNILDHLLGQKYLEEKYLKTCPRYSSGLVAYSQAQRSEHKDAKFRCILIQVAKRLRPDMYDPNPANQQLLLSLTIPDHNRATIERFINYVESLMIELDDIPTDGFLFGWMQKNFANWGPVRDSFKLAYRNPAGWPNRCFAYLWHRVNEEIQWAQIDANKKSQDGWLSSLSKLPDGHNAFSMGQRKYLPTGCQQQARTEGYPTAKTASSTEGCTTTSCASDH